ncbi:MAG: F0F1 ATP synthase subunit A [Alphaproteobacteria bacterium]|nr:F0F1 ATP synthase subunit A [Alphaproteobacteria bacterium]
MNPMEQFAVKPLIPLHIGGYDVSFTNQSLWMCIVIGAITLFMAMATSKRSLVPGRMQSMAEISYEFVANMIGTAAGEDGLRFFPFVFTLFMFVLFSNFLGLLPGSFTVTSQIVVTFALAAFVVAMVIVVGFIRHGIGFLKLFVPHAPWYLLILLIPIEFISFMTRPISLSVRLFANMLAGHTLLKVFASFVIALGGAGGILSLLSVAPFFLIVAITALELLVAFLQAYVFAILTCIYLNEGLHLHEHH